MPINANPVDPQHHHFSDQDIKRIWGKVAGSNDTQKCWEWVGQRNEQGYGKIKIARRWYKAHRVLYALFFGPIPRDLLVCHRCDNPPCVNPHHLWLGTCADNARDAKLKGRYEHRCFRAWNGTRKGENNPYAKLREVQAREIHHEHQRGVPTKHLAEKFGVSQTTISNIAHGRAWPHISSP